MTATAQRSRSTTKSAIEREDLALLRRRERLEVALRRLRVVVRPRRARTRRRRARDEPPDLVDLRRGRAACAREHARARARPRAGVARSSMAMSGSVRLPSRRSAPIALPSRSWSATKSSESSEIWKATPMSRPYRVERVDLLGRDAAEQPADPAARGDERRGLLRDDPEVVRLGRDAAALALELEDLGLRHRHRRAREGLHASRGRCRARAWSNDFE